jgi:hypothetical protein
MKKILTLALAFVLTGCGALAPAATPTAAQPTPTPVVIIQTVEVTVIPTQAPTEVPTSTPAPTAAPQVIVVTATGGPAAASTNLTNSTSPTPIGGQAIPVVTATYPANVGGDYFTNLTRSADTFYLKCQPDTITFGVSTSNPYITEVDLFYRIEDRLSVSITNWKDGGKMVSDKNGNFTLAFSAATVTPDSRSHKAWFDYQFVGINKLGDSVGRTAKISQQVTYKIDCTD